MTGDYSQGMRQRLGIASCLIRRPRLLLLDEPANGVDPAGPAFLRDLLRRLAGEGITILLSSHLLSEVQEVCTRVAVINAGRIVYEGSLAELRASVLLRFRLQSTDLKRVRAVCERLDAREGRVRLTRAPGDAGAGITSLIAERATAVAPEPDPSNFSL